MTTPLNIARGTLSALLLFINLLILPTVVLILTLIDFVIPIKMWHRMSRHITQAVLPPIWVQLNNAILGIAGITWDIQGEGTETLKRDGWYLILSNHQSWADILILEKVFGGKIPKLKFFMKQALLWTLPICGAACWAMGYPFVKRYTKAQIKKNPACKQKNIDNIRKASRQFLERPTTIVNFIEGTRFTPEKHAQRKSPYQHLLRPKALGISLVLETLGEQLDGILDVTITYPRGLAGMWDLISGRAKRIVVRYEIIPPNAAWFGDYTTDSSFRQAFRHLINQRWHKKDALIEQLNDNKSHT